MKDAPPDPDGPSNPVASDPSAYVRQLHRRNEELQVLNEELMVSNEELRQRVREVEEQAEGLEARGEALDDRARRLDRELEELRALKTEIAAATEGPAVGLVFIDRDGRVGRFVGAAAQVFHLRAADQGRPLADMNHELDYEDLMADVRTVIAEGTIHEVEVADTQGRPYLLRIRPYPRGGEQIDGAVLSITGLTGLRDLAEHLDTEGNVQESLRAREQHLTRQTERLDSFAAVVAHELRSPLMAAQGWVEQAQAADDTSYLEQVHQALERMDAIMDDVLTLTWSGRELSADELEACDAARIARRCWDYVHPGTSAVLVTHEVVVQANPPRLERLIENLLRNALAHGGPEVRITVGGGPDSFFVEDDGPGIPAEERESIFVPGYSSNEAGSGLGLSITAAIAEAHGWDLSVVDGRTGGARFEITSVQRESGQGST